MRYRRYARREGSERADRATPASPRRGRPDSAPSKSRPRTVIRSAAPGPAPMKCTVIQVDRASAQVADPIATRGAMRREAGPPAASAAASASEGTPVRNATRSDLVIVRSPAASSASWGTKTSGTPNTAAAAAMPGSSPFAADVAISESAWAASPQRDSAAAITPSIAAAPAPLRQPTPATITA